MTPGYLCRRWKCAMKSEWKLLTRLQRRQRWTTNLIKSMICSRDKHAITFSFSLSLFLVDLGNASLISEALRHYQRLERQNDEETSTKILDKQNRRHYQQPRKQPATPTTSSVVIAHDVTNNKIRVSSTLSITHIPFGYCMNCSI